MGAKHDDMDLILDCKLVQIRELLVIRYVYYHGQLEGGVKSSPLTVSPRPTKQLLVARHKWGQGYLVQNHSGDKEAVINRRT